MTEALLPKEVCRELQVSRDTLLRWTDQGIIHANRNNVMGWRTYSRHEVEKLKGLVRKDRKIGESLLVTA